jgi:Ca2+-binding EF-hand superfamily protein
MAPKFTELDTDGDGYISEEELNVFGSSAVGGSPS